MKMKNKLQQLNLDIVDLVDKYNGKVQTYEIINALIVNAVSISLTCAPNLLLGVKTVLAAVENGIYQHEEQAQEEEETDQVLLCETT